MRNIDKLKSTLIETADQSLFNRIADHYAQKDLIASTRLARGTIIRRAMKPLIESGASLGTLVDVGCGIGAQAAYLAGHYDRYIGVDYSERLVEIGRELFFETENAEFITANIKDAALPKSIADTVLVVTALHHMTDLKIVMEAMARIAKPGGNFVAIEPQRGNPVVQAMRRVRMKTDRNYSADQHFFSFDEIIEMMNLIPMDNIRVEYQGFLTPPFGQVGTTPQMIFYPLSRLACALENAAELVCFGPLGKLSWNIVAYGKFS